SIMPQKRNPVALEHARAIGSKALGEAQAIVTAVHNTPFGDIVDTEDDLQPLVFAMFRDASRAVRLVAAAMATAEFDAARLEGRASTGGDGACTRGLATAAGGGRRVVDQRYPRAGRGRAKARGRERGTMTNPEPRTQNQEPRTKNPEPGTLNPEPTRDLTRT